MEFNSMGFIKLHFDRFALSNPSQLGIWGVIWDHHDKVLKAFSKPVWEGLAEIEILAPLEGCRKPRFGNTTCGFFES